MTNHELVDAHRPWAGLIGYSRAVRIGNIIEVGGTTATLEDGTVVAPGDAYAQAMHVFEVVVSAIRQLGGDVVDIIRTRVYFTDIGDWEKVGRAHGHMFGAVLPASTFVEVSRLLLPDLMIEVEATAIVQEREALNG